MPSLTNHSLIVDAPRAHLSLRGRSNLGFSGTGAKHSPDGHFSPNDIWKPFSTPHDPYIRRRSRDHIDGDLQDVQEDEDADPAHPWRRAQRTDSRSPCPALNVAANHGYLPRDGRGLTMWAIIKALRECYNVSWQLAIVFTIGSFIILRVGGVGYDWLNPKIDLEDLAAHGVLEHNASLTHKDYQETPDSPIRNGSRSPRSRSVSSSSSTADVARARNRRLDSCPNRKTPRHLQQFADAEFCLTLGIFSPGDELKVELEVLREWLEKERLPRGWKPKRELGLWQNHQNTARVQEMMKALRMYKNNRRSVRTVAFE
ncbi:Chloroperoxidase [Hysterangium stoloniferum]|nr:Chloroperoxidase [Hysterangium stoloniferum]